MEYTILFYETLNNTSPVLDYLQSLPIKSKAKILKSLKILQREGVNTPYPYVSHVREKIFELRVKFSSNQYRILYFIYTNRQIILLHGFSKKTQQIPEKEIKKAENRQLEFIERKV